MKKFITGADGARLGIVMAKADAAACLFLVDLPYPAIRLERIVDTIDSSMPGGHAVVAIQGLSLAPEQMSVRPAKASRSRKSASARHACRTACAGTARSLARTRSRAITLSAATRSAKPLIDHEGVGFMLADNRIELQQAELMIDRKSVV